MKATTGRLLALASMAVFATMVHAETMTLGTWASTSTNPGVQNSAVQYLGYNPSNPAGPFALPCAVGCNKTYDLGNAAAVSPWSPAIPPSQWVSNNAKSTVNGGFVDPNGYYAYQLTFTSDGDYSGSLGLLADDTVEVLLDGNLLEQFANNSTNGPCATGGGGATCEGAPVYALMSFDAGPHTLTFIDWQSNLSAAGFDAEGSFSTPEPGSLLLLGTGLAGLAKLIARKAHSA